MNPTQEATLHVTTDLNALTRVLEWFDQFNCPPLDYPSWLQCQLAIAEGFTNAVRHAHRDLSPETPIDLQVQIFTDAIEIRIWDWGPMFDLHQQLDQMPNNLNTEAEGGRGLKLMQRVADSLSYARMSDGRNCLLIMKLLK